MGEKDRDRGAASGSELEGPPEHVVFDFTGLERPDVVDLAMILTARLQSAPTDQVWVRHLPWETARILRAMKLDHLFRRYPNETDRLH
jgi:hypothetical protein